MTNKTIYTLTIYTKPKAKVIKCHSKSECDATFKKAKEDHPFTHIEISVNY